MARAEYHVINRRAPRQATDRGVAAVAAQLRQDLASRTPRGRTGKLRAGWQVQRGSVPGVRVIRNAVPYGRYVEFGTRHMRARPTLGQTLAEYTARPGFRRKR